MDYPVVYKLIVVDIGNRFPNLIHKQIAVARIRNCNNYKEDVLVVKLILGLDEQLLRVFIYQK
ncbi:MAG: hypothetical protein ABFS03_07280 [Chloroflexota bacterium]